MRAARFHGREDIRVEDIEQAPVGDTDVRIAVEACGICGSDLHEYSHGPKFTPEDSHPVTGESLPLPTGHELSGRVTEIGTAVDRIDVGDAVVVEPNIPCHDCLYCEDGKAHLCTNTTAVGWNTGSGGFAESAVVPWGLASPDHDDLDDDRYQGLLSTGFVDEVARTATAALGLGADEQ